MVVIIIVLMNLFFSINYFENDFLNKKQFLGMIFQTVNLYISKIKYKLD